MNPFLGRNFEAMDPLEWLARMSDHIPDPRQHRTRLPRTRFEYSPVARGRREPRADGAAPQALLAGLGTPDRKGL